MSRLLAVDANSLTHRGFHSVLRDSGDVSQVEVPVVVSAVATMIASTWRYGPYDHLVVALDHPHNVRRDDYPEYKGQRAATPQAVKDALAAVSALFDAAGAVVLQRDGAEADDILATVVDITEASALPTDVLSSDRDLIALIDTHTRLLRPKSSFSTLGVETFASVRERYGIEPWQYTELAALRGDPADGLDGVRGIGEKTAAQLLQRYETVLGVYDNISFVPPRIEAALRRDRELVERNLMLMAPRTHLGISRDDVLTTPLAQPRVVDALITFGFDDAARRFARAFHTPTSPPRAPLPEEP